MHRIPPSSLVTDLVRALLAPLAARIQAATTEFRSLTSDLGEDPSAWCGDEYLLAHADSLAAEERQLGWCLGVVAGATGDGLLGVRREAAGLRFLVDLLAAGEGWNLDPAPARLPRLAPTMGEGWEAALAVTCYFWTAGQGLAPGEVLRWRVDRGAEYRRFRGLAGPVSVRAANDWAGLLATVPGARLESRPDGAALAVPDPWFAD